MASSMINKNKISVLGCGVSGLSTGILLLKKGYPVTIWAKDLPPNTTSNKAAAFWYPYLCNPKDKARKWAKDTLIYFRNEILKDSSSGCINRTTIEVFDEAVGDPWWKHAVNGYGKLTKEELPYGYKDGYKIEGMVIDTSIYMDYLLEMFKRLGGQLVQRKVKDIQEPSEEYEIVVNCTGLGSRDLFDDEKIYPVRGQTVKVKPNGSELVIADDEGHNGLAYIVPRINDIVLGGTAQVNNLNLEVDPEDTKEILRKCAAVRPEFKNVEIISESVGLRPVRDEIRLEPENLSGKLVIHNYGHGGAGFTLSWGCAQNVVEIIEKL
jgi:D-amino-acid oxidase